jgi:hypothetical protein
VPNDRELQHLEELRKRMRETSLGIGPALEAHIQATLEFGVQQVRMEYEELAERNLAILRKYSGRTKKLLTALVVVLLGLSGLSLHLTTQSDNLESRTCTIQDGGLKANPHLAAAMKDIEHLLVPIAGQKKTPEPFEHLIVSLRVQLGDYVTIEHGLPTGRSC